MRILLNIRKKKSYLVSESYPKSSNASQGQLADTPIAINPVLTVFDDLACEPSIQLAIISYKR